MKKYGRLLLTIICCMFLLCACGSSDSYATKEAYVEEPAAAAEMYDYGVEEGMYDYAVEEEMYAYDTAGATGTNDNSVTENATNTNRKLIKNVTLDVESKNYDLLMSNLDKEIKSLNGYVESMDAYNGTWYSDSKRYATIKARIPADSLDAFINKIGESANITNRSESVEDVTLAYVDMESHKKMLQEEQSRLLELLKTAENVEDIITIESRLSEVRYQIESMESQLRTYDNLVDYSTVMINISEVEELTPVIEETALQRIQNGYRRSVIDVTSGMKEFFFNLIINSHYIFVWTVVIIVIIFIIRFALKLSDKKMKEKKIKAQTNTEINRTEVKGYPFEQKPKN